MNKVVEVQADGYTGFTGEVECRREFEVDGLRMVFVGPSFEEVDDLVRKHFGGLDVPKFDAEMMRSVMRLEREAQRAVIERTDYVRRLWELGKRNHAVHTYLQAWIQGTFQSFEHALAELCLFLADVNDQLVSNQVDNVWKGKVRPLKTEYRPGPTDKVTYKDIETTTQDAVLEQIRNMPPAKPAPRPETDGQPDHVVGGDG